MNLFSIFYLNGKSCPPMTSFSTMLKIWSRKICCRGLTNCRHYACRALSLQTQFSWGLQKGRSRMFSAGGRKELNWWLSTRSYYRPRPFLPWWRKSKRNRQFWVWLLRSDREQVYCIVTTISWKEWNRPAVLSQSAWLVNLELAQPPFQEPSQTCSSISGCFLLAARGTGLVLWHLRFIFFRNGITWFLMYFVFAGAFQARYMKSQYAEWSLQLLSFLSSSETFPTSFRKYHFLFHL